MFQKPESKKGTDMDMSGTFHREIASLQHTDTSSAGAATRYACSRNFVDSVASRDGLGAFVYLKGRSGRRYVFSPVSSAQTCLYDHAVFASADRDGGIMLTRAASTLAILGDSQRKLYVHVLAEDEGSGNEVLADLG